MKNQNYLAVQQRQQQQLSPSSLPRRALAGCPDPAKGRRRPSVVVVVAVVVVVVVVVILIVVVTVVVIITVSDVVIDETDVNVGITADGEYCCL
jgi:Flp pilus assembly protein TadB